MESPVLLRNSVFILLLTLFACKHEMLQVDKSLNENALIVNHKLGLTYVNDTVFNGTLYKLHPNLTDTFSIKKYQNGLEHGKRREYYTSGILSSERHFNQGKKIGLYKKWWGNGIKKLEYHFTNDEYHQTCKEWNKNGLLVVRMNYEYGHEEGIQTVWYDNGKIKSNYVIKNGRRFGLLGTKNCINVSDSIF